MSTTTSRSLKRAATLKELRARPLGPRLGARRDLEAVPALVPADQDEPAGRSPRARGPGPMSSPRSRARNRAAGSLMTASRRVSNKRASAARPTTPWPAFASDRRQAGDPFSTADPARRSRREAPAGPDDPCPPRRALRPVTRARPSAGRCCDRRPLASTRARCALGAGRTERGRIGPTSSPRGRSQPAGLATLRRRWLELGLQAIRDRARSEAGRSRLTGGSGESHCRRNPDTDQPPSTALWGRQGRLAPQPRVPARGNWAGVVGRLRARRRASRLQARR